MGLPQSLENKISDILSNPFSYKWEVQGFGMLRTYLDKDTRLQIWLKDFIVPDVTDVHTHPWNFTSYIYQGEIINHTFTESPLGFSYRGILFDRCLILTGENAYVKSKETVDLVSIGHTKYKQGQHYYHSKDVPHRIDFLDGTITILTKDTINPNSLAYSYTKMGKEWVSAAPRPATEEEILIFIEAANKI